MLYENYQKKVLKIAGILAKILRLLPVIIPAVVLVIVATITLLAVKGNISEVTCNTEAVYGEHVRCEANAFLSKVWYEYSEDGVMWSEEYPSMPGEYQLRAVSNASFGGKKYSEPKSFTIAKRSLTVSVANQEIVYGEALSISADVAYNDVVVCDRFVTDDAWLATGVADGSYEFVPGAVNDYVTYPVIPADKTLDIAPDKNSIKVLDELGNDVTDAYVIDTETTKIVLKKRPLTIVIESPSKVYDGEALCGGECVISNGSLKEGDEIVATFNQSIVNAGVAFNSPDLKIVNDNGVDVSGYYLLTIQLSMLVVEKRPVNISFADDTLEYAGDVWYDKYDHQVDPDTPLVEGQYIVCSGGTDISDCGDYENMADVDVYDSKGNRVTENYDLSIDRGTITVTPKSLRLKTNSHEWKYDSVEHSDLGYLQKGLLDGHRIEILEYATVKNVGSADNVFKFDIVTESGRIVTHNYDISANWGALAVTPRKLHISTFDGYWTYDGEFHSEYGFEQSGDRILAHQTVNIVDAINIKNVGVVENKFSILIYDGDDPVIENYEITYSYGTLEIVPRYLQITTLDDFWTYDGEFHSQYGFEQSGDGILDHQTYEIFGAPSIRDAGSIKNKFTIKIFGDLYEGEDCDVTANYIISYDYGTLTVDKRRVSLSTEGYTWIYDGKAHYLHKFFTTSELGIVAGEVLEISGWKSITNVGSILNTFDSYKVIRTEEGVSEDITYRNYIIDWTFATLQVDPRPIVCKPVDESKVYDDTPLTPVEAEIAQGISEYDLVEGHYLKVELSGSLTDAGYAESFLTKVLVFDSEGNEITFNYQIEKIQGILEVIPRQITVYTGSASKPKYDGQPLTCNEYGVYPDKLYDLVEGHTIYVNVIGYQTAVGESDNICDEERTYISAKNGRNVTFNYDIRYEYGKLSVNHIAVIYVTSASDWKYWDGTPLTNDGYECTIRDGELDTDSGHKLVVKVTGSITEIGTAPNTMSVTVVDQNGKNVSYLYKIIASEGVLEIKEKTDEPVVHPSFVVGQIKTGVSGYLYLREHSYGNYNGKNWNQAVEYWKTLPGGYNYNYLASIALANMGQSADMAEMKGMAMYMLPYYLGLDGDYEHPAKDTVYDSLMSDYTTSYYFLPDAANGYDFLKGHLGDYAIYEEEYRKFVYDTYLSIDATTLEYMQGIISEQGFDSSDPLVIQKVAEYIQHAAEYNLQYDVAMDSEENVVIAFLNKYKEGICVHYASSATLLYRALGIPARYVEGFTVATKAGEFVDITTPGHAWVEVYIDGFGWVQVEVTGSLPDGSIPGGSIPGGGDTELKLPIVIKPAYQYKVWDGEPLIASTELEFDPILSELLNNGYSYYFGVEGSQTEVGKGVSKAFGFVLLDPDNVDVTENYNIKYEDGVLEVLPPEKTLIRVYLYQLQKFYDGTPLTFEDMDYEIIEIPDGFELSLSLNISLTEAGQITLSEINENLEDFVVYRVYKDGIDVTENCVLIFNTFDYGNDDYIPIKVDKRPITVTSASETKVEDGKPLENGSFAITVGSLIEGHIISVKVVGYIDEVGSDLNYIEYVTVTTQDGIDVTENYDITQILGELTIVSKDG